MKTSNTLTEIILKMCSTCLSLLVETTGQNSALFGYLSHQYEGKYCASLVWCVIKVYKHVWNSLSFNMKCPQTARPLCTQCSFGVSLPFCTWLARALLLPCWSLEGGEWVFPPPLASYLTSPSLWLGHEMAEMIRGEVKEEQIGSECRPEDPWKVLPLRSSVRTLADLLTSPKCVWLRFRTVFRLVKVSRQVSCHSVTHRVLF